MSAEVLTSAIAPHMGYQWNGFDDNWICNCGAPIAPHERPGADHDNLRELWAQHLASIVTTAQIGEQTYTQRDLSAMACHMLAEGSTAEEIVYAIEKPWKHADVFDRMLGGSDVDMDVVHLLGLDGKCQVSVNGQGHFPCVAHSGSES